MFQLIIQWLLSAIAVMIVSNIVPGFDVQGMIPALIVAVVVGLVNAMLGALLKVITSPVIIITFAAFIFLINTLMVEIISRLIDGFNVWGWDPALWTAGVLTGLCLLFRVGFGKR